MPLFHRILAAIKRRCRFKQSESLEERRAAQAIDLRSKAMHLPDGLQREAPLQQAQLCDEPKEQAKERAKHRSRRAGRIVFGRNRPLLRRKRGGLARHHPARGRPRGSLLQGHDAIGPFRN